MNYIKDSNISEDAQHLVKAGWLNSSLDITDTGKTRLMEYLLQKEMKTIVKEMRAEEARLKAEAEAAKK